VHVVENVAGGIESCDWAKMQGVVLYFKERYYVIGRKIRKVPRCFLPCQKKRFKRPGPPPLSLHHRPLTHPLFCCDTAKPTTASGTNETDSLAGAPGPR
jgi:hypothetical protein